MDRRRSSRPGVLPLVLAGCVAATGCPRLILPSDEEPPCTGTRRTDVFEIGANNKVDVLIVVDTRSEMEEVLGVVEMRLARLFSKLFDEFPQPDFHVALAPTNLGGELLPVPPRRVAGDRCDGSVEPDVPRVRVDAGPGSDALGSLADLVKCADCPRYLSRAQCSCGVLGPSVCNNLRDDVHRMLGSMPVNPGDRDSAVGVVGTLRAALGLIPVCGEGAFRADPPPANAGFYRHDANLVVIVLAARDDTFFVTAGRDPARLPVDTEAEYLELLRLLRSLKGPGRAHETVLATIGGLCPPTSDMCSNCVGSLCAPCAGEGCKRLSSTPDLFCGLARDTRNQSAHACGPVSVAQDGQALDFDQPPELSGCRIPRTDGSAAHFRAPVHLMSLACDTGGAVYNLCAPDWSSVVTAELGARLRANPPTLRLQQAPASAERTTDCESGTGACVTITTPDGLLVTLDEDLLTVNPSAQSVTLGHALAPGTRVEVSYDVAGTPECCAAGCGAGTFCNNPSPERGFCQSLTCSTTQACPAGAGVCDLQACDGDSCPCIPPGRCTRDEHCPTGFTCDCATQACTRGAGGTVCTQ